MFDEHDLNLSIIKTSFLLASVHQFVRMDFTEIKYVYNNVDPAYKLGSNLCVLCLFSFCTKQEQTSINIQTNFVSINFCFYKLNYIKFAILIEQLGL